MRTPAQCLQLGLAFIKVPTHDALSHPNGVAAFQKLLSENTCYAIYEAKGLIWMNSVNECGTNLLLLKQILLCVFQWACSGRAQGHLS